ncbi:MAG: HDOD domain-containing protein [Bdellovibrionota bacterium]
MNLDYFYVPPLPETLVSCISYMYADSFDYDILVKKITSDVGLTEKLFTVANSQYYSQGAVATSNLKQALTRIGVTSLLKILTSEYYNTVFKNTETDFFTLRDFNRHASYVSHLAVTLGEHLQVEDTNDLMIAGLFHDIGLLARSHCQNSLMQKIVHKCKENKIDFYSAEMLETLPTHDALGKQVANKWNLSDRVTFLIEHHHTPENQRPTTPDYGLHKELDILTFADTLAHRMKFGYNDYIRDTKVNQSFLDRLGLSLDIIAKKTQDTFKAVTALSF